MTDIARERALLAAEGLVIARRETWGARNIYNTDRRVEEPARWFILHISVTDAPQPTISSESNACVEVEDIGISRFGRDSAGNWVGCSYNAGVMQSGRLYEMQPLTRRGAHTLNDKDVPGFPTSLNYAGRACVLVQQVSDVVTLRQIDSAARWAAAQILAGLARRDAVWFGHRDFAPKSCPGDNGYAKLPQLRQLTAHYVSVGLAPPSPAPGEDDMAAFAVVRCVGKPTRIITSYGQVIEAPGADGTAMKAELVGSGWRDDPDVNFSDSAEGRRLYDLFFARLPIEGDDLLLIAAAIGRGYNTDPTKPAGAFVPDLVEVVRQGVNEATSP